MKQETKELIIFFAALFFILILIIRPGMALVLFLTWFLLSVGILKNTIKF